VGLARFLTPLRRILWIWGSRGSEGLAGVVILVFVNARLSGDDSLAVAVQATSLCSMRSSECLAVFRVSLPSSPAAPSPQQIDVRYPPRPNLHSNSQSPVSHHNSQDSKHALAEMAEPVGAPGSSAIHDNLVHFDTRNDRTNPASSAKEHQSHRE